MEFLFNFWGGGGSAWDFGLRPSIYRPGMQKCCVILAESLSCVCVLPFFFFLLGKGSRLRMPAEWECNIFVTCTKKWYKSVHIFWSIFPSLKLNHLQTFSPHFENVWRNQDEIHTINVLPLPLFLP